MEQILQTELAALVYAAGFGVAGVVCLAGLVRARKVSQDGIRRGLVWLLLTSGLWSVLKVGFLVGPDPLRRPLYVAGLIIGFGTVWAWLYFAAAYTGRNYHHRPALRRLGLGVFLAVVAVKLTNPVHGLYFTATETTTPFTYLAISHGTFHWIATGLSYVLAGVGLFMLYELFIESGYDTRPLAVLTTLLGVPVVLDIAALVTPLVEVIYAPLGVAGFTVGVLFVYERRFLAVQATGRGDDPVVFLDDSDRVRDYTPAATAAFPGLSEGLGRPLEDVAPGLAPTVDGDEQIVGVERDGERQYYLAATSELELGDVAGQVVMISNVTAAERRRRELARHNQQLEEFASALTHELRNVIQIIDSRLMLAREQTHQSDGAAVRESVERASEVTDRMSGLVDDFRSLARYGQTIEQLQQVQFVPAVQSSWKHAETGGMSLAVDGEGSIRADPGRLRQLLINAFEFARHTDAETVHVELLADGFAVATDGEPPREDTAGYFEFGEAVPDAESGMKLPNVRAFARVHGWRVGIDETYREGTRIRVHGVTLGDSDRADTETGPVATKTDGDGERAGEGGSSKGTGI